MKKVVLKGGYGHDVLLSPKWAVKFLERKGYENIRMYAIEDHPSGYDTLSGRDAKCDNSYFQRDSIVYSEKRLNNVRWVDVKNKDLIPYEALISNREDEDLIAIAEQITGGDIKIVEIPDDIQYFIKEKNCEEVIQEKSRIWK